MQMQTIKKIKIVLSLIALSSITLLSGCAGTKTNFDCNTVGGIQGCATLGHVNRMANQGDFNRDAEINGSPNTTVSSNTSSVKPTGYFLKTPGVDTPASGAPMRYGETMQNVWIAPYVTKDGSYMWASMASIIVQPGHWIGEPAAAISQSGDV
ncbi:MAG: type IV conjugative transfer system lipoprotein TraV [Gammaproteobacteria bacterium]|nr:type IV conjugative transfer system lipoprotein TraV [Gammaproteobacteria bacterium]